MGALQKSLVQAGPDVEALSIAMAIAPGVYSRNRFFDLFKSPDVRRARSRALLVRGIVHHLSTLRGVDDIARTVVFERKAGRVACRYEVPSLRFARQTELTELESSCLRYLAEKAGLPGFRATGEEKEQLRAALVRLSGGEATLLLR